MAVDFPLVPGVIKLQYHWTYGSDANVMSHTYWSNASTAPGTPELQGFVNLAATSWDTNLSAMESNRVTLTKVTGTYLGDVTSAVPEWNGSFQGGKLDSPLPASACALIHLKIARRYRGGKPRLYLPLGVSSDIGSPQTWGSSFLGNVNTKFAAYVTALQAYTAAMWTAVTLCSVSYFHGNALRTTPVVDLVTATSCSSQIGSQRRRITG